MIGFVEQWKVRARKIKKEVFALYLAYRDPAVPWYAKAFAAVVVAYAFSPIDLIPDFIPVLGYIDDLILIPLGITVAMRLIPPEIMTKHRNQAEMMTDHEGPEIWWIAVIIIILWVIVAAIAVYSFIQWLAR